MALVVNHNIPALQTYNALTATTNSLQKSIQKLSTGLRINSAADDAAGLAISEKMRAQIRGLDRAAMNAQDGISMIQTAEGALIETHSILQRMRELSIQAANDTLTRQDRAYIQLEIDQLKEEVTRIGNTTQFNKKKLLDGSAAVLWSSSDLDVKVIVNGGLRELDQFGQKVVKEGNYKITVEATGGKNQILKTNIFRIKHSSSTANAGAIATMGTKLYDIEQFWDKQGRFLLTDPQTITITQGDGTKATFTLYQNDTIETMAKKINEAIAKASTKGGLGQVATGSTYHATFVTSSAVAAKAAYDAVLAKYPPASANHPTVVDAANVASAAAADRVQANIDDKKTYDIAAATSGLFSVNGTIIIQSSVLGSIGKLNFSGDEDLIKALGLSQIQRAEEVDYKIKIEDAHGNLNQYFETVETQITGNRMIGLLHTNIDVIFNPGIGIKVAATGGLGGGVVKKSALGTMTGVFGFEQMNAASSVFYIHLADNTTVFQIGANEGEDMGINIGDMRSEALGLNKVLVTDRDSAARSITIIDAAIDRVSMQRARLGAYQNRLEHTINNLTVAAENLTASESRIRDTDMAKEMMNFTKLQIMLQAGTAMLAQANTIPQNVLSLIR